MPRFIYSASAFALGGRITRPIDHPIEPKAACLLPPTGGRASVVAPAFSLTDPASGQFLLSFDSAETTILGEEAAPGIHNTVVTSVIRGLNILNVLRAGQVVAKLSLTYELARDHVSIETAGSGFVNLTIAGQPFEVGLDHARSREAADYESFRRKHRETRGRVFSSLALRDGLQSDDSGHGWHHHADFGRIYFAEWSAAPHTQTLTMLRLSLGSRARGDLDVGAGQANGVPYP